MALCDLDRLLEQDDFSWVPHGQALSIPTDNTVAEEHARRVCVMR